MNDLKAFDALASRLRWVLRPELQVIFFWGGEGGGGGGFRLQDLQGLGFRDYRVEGLAFMV